MANCSHERAGWRMLQSGKRHAIVSLTGVVILALGPAWTQQTTPAVTGDKRVDVLLKKMTLEEKIALIHGTNEDPATFQGQAGYLAGIPRLGIPFLRFADGPPGVLTRIPASAPTDTMGLAATFSREDAEQNGVLIAQQAKARGIDVVLEPFINMDRDLTFTRDFNTFGEDPFLTGQIGAAQVRGTQGQGVMSQAKHYVAYDTATVSGRNALVTVDQQTLHEIYLMPFADAVDAGVSSLMCSYGIVNGRYSCGDSYVLETILRNELGFKGFVTSDWGATHATTFINEGLDMEMGGPLAHPRVPGAPPVYEISFFAHPPVSPDPNSKPAAPNQALFLPHLPEEPPIPRIVNLPEFAKMDMLEAVKAGLVSEATVTQAAGRVLYEMDKFGYLDHPPNHNITAPVGDGDPKIIEKTDEDAAVLLKNEGNILPLSNSDLASLAMVGPGGTQISAVGRPYERAQGLPARQIGPLAAVQKEAAGKANIAYAVADDMGGVTIPAQFLAHDGKPGLERTEGSSNQIDSQIDFTDANGKSLPANSSHVWEGTLRIPSSGDYRLHLQLLGAFGTLSVDGHQVARVYDQFVHGDVTQAGHDDAFPTRDGLDSIRVQLKLDAGPHPIILSITPDTSNNPEQVRLNWLVPEQRKADYDAAIATARQAKIAIVFAWRRNVPDFALPGDQDKLIEDIAAVNPNTVVVLNIDQPIAMPWLSKVKGVLQIWHGDESGWATARILLGKTSPAGRLPYTWPQRLEDMPVHAPGHEERLEATDGATTYSEGIFMGYRWFDKQGIQPLFPFGFGLTYTKFTYSDLKASPNKDGGLTVSLVVKNTGARASDEVPQVYLGAPDHQPVGVQFAVRSLAAFDRIHLEPGQSQIVTLKVRERSLQYWSAASAQWVTAVGARTLYAGPSSRDLPLQTRITVPN
jgi:beta-glucosidase